MGLERDRLQDSARNEKLATLQDNDKPVEMDLGQSRTRITSIDLPWTFVASTLV